MKPLFHKFFGTAIIVLLASCSASMDERRVFSYVILTDPSQNISSLFKVTEADARRFAGLGEPGEECRTISVADAEVYEYFGQVRVLDDAGVYSSYYWLMNWGANGHFDNDHFHVSDSAWVAGSYRYRYEKEIYYGFE